MRLWNRIKPGDAAADFDDVEGGGDDDDVDDDGDLS